ncbi:hypothetical protein ABV837_001270 [Campylobacter upsaliensis]|nr:hypothetical protein [Campylobacter upsaliensis]EAI4100997.1 hypothetical protein [Campylobacter jejuni]EAI5623454.1 hypothetical protein [Campylobacter upsaliensis]EAJ7579082.1 hypothetical protein [Campylobacter upsaliensis]EAK0492155.1 hypothetical protein [Campylobacter upsaliensis]
MTQADLINRFCEHNLTKCEQFLMDYYAKDLKVRFLELKLHNKIKLNYEKEMQTLHSKYQDFLETERQCFQQMTKIKRI